MAMTPLDETDAERIKREHPTLWRNLCMAIGVVIVLAIGFGAFIASLLLIKACWWLVEAIL